MDRNLFEGVFAGEADPAEAPVDETFRLYRGTLPADRDPSFWSLYEKNWHEYVSEEDVFNVLLRRFDDAGDKSWEIGIGRGGQLYSWRGAWGEAMAPQAAPWMDEVWQATMHSPHVQNILAAVYQHDPEQSNHTNSIGQAFVHGSGCSNKYGAASDEPYAMFFCPKLASWYDQENKSYAIINWGQSSTQPTIFPHKILYYSRYRYLGDGVLEVTNVIHNFGDYTYGYNGTPWGGVRATIFPEIFWSDADSSYAFNERIERFGRDNVYRPPFETDGWLGAAASKEDPTSPAFGFVFGRDVASCCVGSAGHAPPRDYIVMASNPGGGVPNEVGPDRSFWVRYYLVVGSREHVIRTARKVAEKAGWGDLDLPEDRASTQPLYRSADGELTRDVVAGTAPVCRVYNEPVQHAKPLFAIRERAGSRGVVTTNPYALSRTEPYANPLPEDHAFHAELQDAIKRYTYESEDRKRLQWELLGFVLPAAMVGSDRAAYVALDTLIEGADTEGMLVLGPGTLHYSNLTATAKEGSSPRVTVTAVAQNANAEPVTAVARLYLDDREATVPVPQRKLVGTRKLQLAPGQQQTIEFELTADQLSVLDPSGDRVVEPGAFELRLGNHPHDAALAVTFKLKDRVVLQQGARFRPVALEANASILANEVVSLRAKFANEGPMQGTRMVDYTINGKLIGSRRLRLTPGEVGAVELSTQLFELGTHEIRAGDLLTHTIEVLPRAPTFSVAGLHAPGLAFAGQDVAVAATITNLGSEAAPTAVDLCIKGQVAGTQELVVPAASGGGSASVQFSHRFDKPGIYPVSIGGLSPVEVAIAGPLRQPYRAFTNTTARMLSAGDRFVITANRSDTWVQADAYGAIHGQPLTGDFSALVRIDHQEQTNTGAKAGLIVRNELTKPGQSNGYVSLVLSPKWRCQLLWDSDENGFLDRAAEIHRESICFPIWLKLQKRGQVFSGFYSDDGEAWERVGTVRIPSAAAVQDLGLHATCSDQEALYWARFSGLDARTE